MKPTAAPKSFSSDWDAIQSGSFGAALTSFAFGLLFFVGGIIGSFGNHDLQLNHSYFGMFACWAGMAFVAIGRLARYGRKNQTLMMILLTEQDERIRNLESQLAALSSPSPKS